MMDVLLSVPNMQQGYNAGCGLASIGMALAHAGVPVTVAELERHPLVLPSMLKHWGLGPGRLARIARSFGVPVTLIEPSRREVGTRFVTEGGAWLPRTPTETDICELLRRGVPPVVCIPDKTKAFAGTTHHGSHWVIVVGSTAGDLRIQDPAPWRKVDRCLPGYWATWRCSLIAIGDRCR
jgi:hypothetical protein